jgi:starch phosphorylase
MQRVKQSLKFVSAQFNCSRMLTEYNNMLYLPAHRAWTAMQQREFAPAREGVRFQQRLRQVWDAVKFVEVSPRLVNPVRSGEPIPLRAAVDLAGLDPNDVHVEAVIGRVGVEGHLEDTTVLRVPPCEQSGNIHVFATEYIPEQTGRLGYAVRISPNHSADPLTQPCNAFMKWA